MIAGSAIALVTLLQIVPQSRPAEAAGSEPVFSPAAALATEFMRTALSAAQAEPLTVEALEMSALLSGEALALDSDNSGLWHLALELAFLAENEALQSRAIERLRELDPDDQTIALMRLHQAVAQHQTAEERAAFYERFLDEENVGKLGAPLASRLAFDLALLEHRRGNVEAFSRRLSQSLALDRSNRAAAALAAGFFQGHVSDPVGEAELLSNLMIADPTDIGTQVSLGQLLLENGAYVAAERIYSLALAGFNAAEVTPSNEFLVDLSIAQWAKGDQRAALETVQRRQNEIDEIFRTIMRRRRPETTATELAKLKAPIEPTLATVAAVIHAGRRDEQAAAARENAVDAHQNEIENRRNNTAEPASPAELARLQLETAWVAAWLGAEAERVQALVDAASAAEPLTDNARARFDGWIALRRGETERAVDILQPIAEADVAARLGLALALLEQGDRKEAARQFLAANRAQPGSLIGIWAAGRLAELVGQRMPLSEVAQQLERLIASIPSLFDRYPSRPSTAISMRLVPAKLTVAPYEPIIFTVELTNKTMYPLAIDSDGPIRPQILVAPTVRSASREELSEVPAFVMDIGRRLRLMPRETMSVSVDLRLYAAGERLNRFALEGAIVKLVAQLNFFARVDGVILPGLYGLEVEAPLIRVDGARVTVEWIQNAIMAMGGPIDAASLPGIALLAQHLARPLAESEPAETKALHSEAGAAFADAFGRLDPGAQAWILAVGPPGGLPAPVLDTARKSDERLVRLSYLLYQLGGPDDAMLNAAKRGDDTALRRVAELIEQALRVAPAAGAAPGS